MIELPEALTLAAQLDQALKGKTITHLEAAHSPHGFAFFIPEAPGWPGLLEGHTIQATGAAGGHVWLDMGEVRLVLNDGVNLRLLGPGQAPPQKHQLYMAFEDGTGLVCTVQMYAGFHVYGRGSAHSPYYEMAMQKPSPLTEGFDPAYFLSLVGKAPAKLSAKALLATEQRIPGLGNGCLQDILWNAQIHPQSHIGALEEGALERLFGSVKTTLEAMARRGGRNTEKDLFGQPGGYACVLCAKTLAYPCPRCGGGLARKAYMGGNVYFCPSCQPVEK